MKAPKLASWVERQGDLWLFSRQIPAPHLPYRMIEETWYRTRAAAWGAMRDWREQQRERARRA